MSGKGGGKGGGGGGGGGGKTGGGKGGGGSQGPGKPSTHFGKPSGGNRENAPPGGQR